MRSIDRPRLTAALCTLMITIAACDRPAAPARPVLQAGTVVDSIFPLEEDVRRFKIAHQTESSAGLSGGARSLAQLVHAFVAALERRDTAALGKMAIGPGEFIDFYYPSSSFARPPYRQSPALVWFQFQQNSRKGLSRALDRYGSRASGLRSFDCPEEPAPLGQARVWQDCQLEWDLRPARIRLFGSIIELNGQFKFVSYANDL